MHYSTVFLEAVLWHDTNQKILQKNKQATSKPWFDQFKYLWNMIAKANQE